MLQMPQWDSNHRSEFEMEFKGAFEKALQFLKFFLY